jgi:hypothetical protein
MLPLSDHFPMLNTNVYQCRNPLSGIQTHHGDKRWSLSIVLLSSLSIFHLLLFYYFVPSFHSSIILSTSLFVCYDTHCAMNSAPSCFGDRIVHSSIVHTVHYIAHVLMLMSKFCTSQQVSVSPKSTSISHKSILVFTSTNYHSLAYFEPLKFAPFTLPIKSKFPLHPRVQVQVTSLFSRFLAQVTVLLPTSNPQSSPSRIAYRILASNTIYPNHLSYPYNLSILCDPN